MLGAFLLIAVVCDLRWRKIPNKLVVIALFLGFCIRVYDFGWLGFANAALGSLTGFGLFLPFYFLSILGAGDVKFMAAAGTFLNPTQVLLASIIGITLNGLIGLTIIVLSGDLPRTFRRYMAMLTTFATLRKPHYIAPAPGEAAGRKMPYAIGLSVGVAAVSFDSGTFLRGLW